MEENGSILPAVTGAGTHHFSFILEKKSILGRGPEQAILTQSLLFMDSFYFSGKLILGGFIQNQTLTNRRISFEYCGSLLVN